MAETPNQQKSQFVATFRLKPERSFAALQAKVITGYGYELSFQNDLVWISLWATERKWHQSCTAMVKDYISYD